MDNFDSTLVPLEETTDMTDIEYDTSFAYIHKYCLYIEEVTNIVTICIELPVLCWAVFALYHQIQANNTILVYVMNLLISDFIQVIARIVLLIKTYTFIGISMFMFGIGLSIGFMVAIALERYLGIVHPIWYRMKRTKKHSILISLAIWVFLVLIGIGLSLMHWYDVEKIVITFFFILPLPLLLFFLGATWRALSHSKLKPKEKKRILVILALVLLLYFILILPTILLFFYHEKEISDSVVFKLRAASLMFLYISPLIDAVLYILIKKDASDTGKVPHCHWRLRAHRQNRETPTVPAENVTIV